MVEDNAIWVGLDYGVYETALCVIDNDGAILFEGTSDSSIVQTAIMLSLYKDRIRLVGAEAGVGTYLIRGLIAEGFPVAPFECRQASKLLSIKRNKTDRNDAAGLAQIARLGRHVISTVHIKSMDFQRVRNWLKLRSKLIRLRMGAEDGIKTLFSSYGVRIGSISSEKGLNEAIQSALAKFPDIERREVEEDIAHLVSTAKSLRIGARRLEKRIRDFCNADDICKRFLEIPGVGPICAASFYTTIEKPDRFERSATVAAYLGLTPRVRVSGKGMSRPRISKMGHSDTRRNLVLAARVMLRPATKSETALRSWGA